MATVRIVRGQVERPLGEELPAFEVPTDADEHVLSVEIRGGHMRSLSRPAVYTYTAIVVKKES